ncbi:MAG: WD40 repeat domain-containing protein [Leptolyngbyaceae cyanobacterium MO_188.B28]|nr:WD40 repeat domain-containing protein [Leptolyngbyaceae cyanobacterium MO_188.B28]
MALHLGQLIYTSFADVGFRTLASAEVPLEIQQAFRQRVVYQCWDAYNPPDSGYRAAYLYQLSLDQTLFGWLYNDGIDDLGRSHVPYFICYYLAGRLQPSQLDSIFVCLQTGPAAVISRQTLPDSLESIVFPDVWSDQSTYLGVTFAARVREQSKHAVKQGKLLTLFAPVDPAAVEDPIDSSHFLQDLSPSEALLAACNGGMGNSCLSRAQWSEQDIKGDPTVSKIVSQTLQSTISTELARNGVDDYRQMLLANAQIEALPQRESQASSFSAAKPFGSRLEIATSAVSLVALMLIGFYGIRANPLASIAPFRPQNIPTRNLPVKLTPLILAKTLNQHSDSVWSVALSPDGQTLVSSSADKTIKIWQVETGQVLQTLSGHDDTVRAIALSADGRTLASGSGDNTIKLWNIETGQLIRTLAEHPGPVWSVAISPDGQTLISGGEDGTLKIWDLQTGDLLRTIPAHLGRVFSVAIAPDGETIATGGIDTTLKLWRLQTGELLSTIAAHSSAVRTVGFSPDGQHLASGSWDTTIKLWNWRNRALIHTLVGHTQRVVTVAFSPNGQTLVSGSLDQTLKLWDVATGELRQTLTGHSDWVLAIATDSNRLISSSKDKTIQIWSRSSQ